MDSQLKKLSTKLKDERSKKVIFVAHCILNENTRYFGGAFNKCFNNKIINEMHKRGYGIVQMQCPEQKAWGGVLKKYIWLSLGSKKTILYKFKNIILPIFLLYTKKVTKKLLKR